MDSRELQYVIVISERVAFPKQPNTFPSASLPLASTYGASRTAWAAPFFCADRRA